MSMFGKKKAKSPEPMQITFTYPKDSTSGETSPDTITVKKSDHYLPRSASDLLSAWGIIGFGPYRQTYKEAYEGREKRIKRLEQFLDDLLILDPSIKDKFDTPHELEDDEDAPAFRWDFDGAHDAAEVLRSDAAEAKKREAVKRFQGKK